MLCLYIKYIYISYKLYENKYMRINTLFSIMSIFSKYILYVCVSLYIHNKYTQYTHIYYVNKNFYFGCDLIVNNHLTAQIYIYTKMHIHFFLKFKFPENIQGYYSNSACLYLSRKLLIWLIAFQIVCLRSVDHNGLICDAKALLQVTLHKCLNVEV